VCHAGYEWKRYLYVRDAWVAKSIETWEWLGTRISDEGARLMLENTYEDGPDDIKVLFEELENLNVGFCLDTGHQAAFGSSPLETWLQSLGHYIEQVHLHDNDGNEDTHLALGQGEIDFSALFDYLKITKKEPPVITLEPHKEEDLWPSVDYLEKIWPW
jgi:sugar phosphate isomerase/epimerase